MVTEIDIVIVDSIIVNADITLIVMRNHASLENLDYEHSGHTGFASSADLAGKQDALVSGTNIKTVNGASILGSGNVTTAICEVVETGKLIKKLYSEISQYKLVFCYGYRDALNAPNQFMFAFIPDQLQVDGEDLQFYTIAGSSNWAYPIKVKRSSDGYVYWWSSYDYSGNTTFFVTKIVGVK